jgi:hypothetical protein
MAGLLAMPKPTGNAAPLVADEGAPMEVQPDQGLDRDSESNVGPEEQAQYDEFVKKGAELIYVDGDDGAEVEPTIVEALSVPERDPDAPQGGNPSIMALANATFNIVKKLDESAIEQGVPISDDVLYHGGTEILEELAEVARTAGIHDYTEEEMSGALYQTVDLFRDHAIKTGRTSEETLKSQFGEVEEADAAGKLGDLLPGFDGTTLGAPAVEPA